MVEKLERDGMVAVLYSPGWGAGWSTWNTNHAEELLFDKELVLALENGGPYEVEKIIESRYPEYEIYTGGVSDLKIAWVPKGDVFRIDEYDGNESIVYLGDEDDLWMVA